MTDNDDWHTPWAILRDVRAAFVNPPYGASLAGICARLDQQRTITEVGCRPIDLLVTRPMTLTHDVHCRNCTIESHGSIDLNGFALLVLGDLEMLSWRETRIARRRRRRTAARLQREAQRAAKRAPYTIGKYARP